MLEYKKVWGGVKMLEYKKVWGAVKMLEYKKVCGGVKMLEYEKVGAQFCVTDVTDRTWSPSPSPLEHQSTGTASLQAISFEKEGGFFNVLELKQVRACVSPSPLQAGRHSGDRRGGEGVRT